ncbi:MAG: cytochrome c maturation protein CcmE [Coriobacteriaceae bacterium]
MNAKMKKRMIAVSGVIVIVLILVLAFVGGNTAATTMSIAEAAENPQAGQKVQVSGNVVQDSFSTSNDVLTFKIYDPEGDPATQLEVRYDGAASSTFGNDVTAICTGKINDAGVLECSELVTKCPSKYENADSALTVEQLLGYGESVYGNVVKVAGSVGAGSLRPPVRATASSSSTRRPATRCGRLRARFPTGSPTVPLWCSRAPRRRRQFAATDVALEGCPCR